MNSIHRFRRLRGLGNGYRNLCLFSFFILHSAFLPACPPDWQTAPRYLGYASPTGSFHYWRGIATVDFGKGLKVPVRFDFDSARDEPSPYLGAGWHCVLLEAGVVQKFPGCLEVTLLGGQKLALLQDKKNPTKYTSQDTHWRAERKGDQLDVVRDCGWAMKFRVARTGAVKGQITSLTTDRGRTLTWEYNGTVATAIREAGSRAGGPGLEFQFDPGAKSGALPTALVIRSATPGGVVTWKYPLEFAAVEGEPGETSLRSLVWPNGTKEAYRLKPASLVIATPDRGERAFTWNAATGRILTDCDGWKYRVGALKSDWERPPVSRTNKDGQTESYHENLTTGIITSQSADGIVTKQHFIITPGPNFMDLKKTEETKSGKTTITYQAAYDATGKMLLETKKQNGNDVVTIYEYEGLTNRPVTTSEGQIIYRQRYNKNGSIVGYATPQEETTLTYNDDGTVIETITPAPTQRCDISKKVYDAHGKCIKLYFSDGTICTWQD